MLLPLIESWIKVSALIFFFLFIVRSSESNFMEPGAQYMQHGVWCSSTFNLTGPKSVKSLIHRHESSSSALTHGREKTPEKSERSMDRGAGEEKLKAEHYILVLSLLNLFLQLVCCVFCFCNGTFLLQYNFFSQPTSIPASANRHDYSICNSITNHLLENSICSSPYRPDKHFETWEGHKADFKVGFLQINATEFPIEMFWNEMLTVFLSLFLYGVYRKDIEGSPFPCTF